MKGYVHVVAIASIASLFTIYYGHVFFSFVFILWLGYLYYDRRLTKKVVFISIASLLFFHFYLPQPSEAPAVIEKNSQKELYEGKIIKPVTETESKIEFTLKEELTEHHMLVVYFPKENEELSGKTQFKHGARCVLQGEIQHPSRSRNPGQFDVQKYLSSQNISYQIILDTLDDIQCEGGSRWNQLYELRKLLIKQMDFTYDPFTASWVNSLVFGDDSKLEKETIQLLERWGLSHLIAISGTHIGLFIAFLYFILVKWNLLTKEKAQQVLIFLLPIYAVLAGGEPSVIRASLMALALLLFQKWNKKYLSTDILSFIYLLLILYNPYYIFHVGFQFSFLVTFALLLCRNWLFEFPSIWVQMLRISFVSQMAIIPLQLHYFTIFEPLSILLNVVVVPYFSLFVIPFMYILVPLSFLSPKVICPFDTFFQFVHEKVLSFIHLFDDHLRFPWLIDDVPLIGNLLFYCIFFLLMKRLLQKEKYQAMIFGGCLTLWFLVIAISPYFSPTGTVTMLDIGQGDAFVIELPYRRGVIMIDAGTRFDYTEEKPSERIYEHIIKPFLYSKGIHSVDSVIITHDDLDHNGSVPFMVKDGIVDQIIISDYYEPSEEELSLWHKHDVAVKRVKQGDILAISGQRFQVLSPKENYRSSNGNSLVLYTKFGGLDWLFTGDIEKEQEMVIIHHYRDLTADVLKVAHHGSKTSSDELFLRQMEPKVALISVGENNRFQHPSPEVIELLEKYDIRIFRTDRHGAVQFKFKGEDGTFLPFLP